MSKKPNVILIFIDDLGYGDISSFNEDSKLNTINIDYLAEHGMRFTDSHSSSPLCSPSRYALLTGRYNFRSKLKQMVLAGDSTALIEKDRTTMAHIFKEGGYRTACVGKWHLGMEWTIKETCDPADFTGATAEHYKNLPDRTPFSPFGPTRGGRVEGLDFDYTKPLRFGPRNYGFDYFFGTAASWDQPPYVYIENDKVVKEPTTLSGVEAMPRHLPESRTQWECGAAVEGYDPVQVPWDMQNKVLNLIDDFAQGDDPFFLYYPMHLTHTPFLPSPEFDGKSGLNGYGDLVLEMDHMVGQITKRLEDKGLLEDTVIVFTADNGCSDAADFPYLLSQGHNPSYQFRAQKGSMYEGGHRVPTIVHYPKKVQSGSICDANVCHTDFFKTFADLLGVSVPETAAEDSFSNLNLWYGTGDCERQATVCNSGGGYLGLIKGGYKLLCCENGGGGGGPRPDAPALTAEVAKAQKFELYNLYADVGETTDIYDTHPEVVDQLLAELNRVFENGRSNDGAVQQNFVPAEWPQINFRPEV